MALTRNRTGTLRNQERAHVLKDIAADSSAATRPTAEGQCVITMSSEK